MCALLGLRLGEGRSEVDAFLDFEEEGLERFCRIELKSTTTDSVSTARDVGPNHIQRWRNRVWVFGFYDRSVHGMDLRTLRETIQRRIRLLHPQIKG